MITKVRSFLADRGALLNAIETLCPDAVEQIWLSGAPSGLQKTWQRSRRTRFERF